MMKRVYGWCAVVLGLFVWWGLSAPDGPPQGGEQVAGAVTSGRLVAAEDATDATADEAPASAATRGPSTTRLSWRVFDSADEAFDLELPAIGRFAVSVDERRRLGEGDVVVSGRIDGGETGLVTLARRGRAVSGFVTGVGGGAVRLTGAAGGDLVVSEEVPPAGGLCGGGLATPAGLEGDPAPKKKGGEKGEKADEVIVDLLVAYTQLARRRAGGVDEIEADILGIVSLSNGRFALSGIEMELRLVGMREVDYAETGDGGDDLRALTTEGDGELDEVHLMRAETGADLVALLVGVSDVGGVAWLAGGGQGSADWGFSLTESQTLAWAFTHEIGHNCGCAHDVANAGFGGVYAYSYGNHFTGNDGVYYRTQMAYSPGLRTDFFSSPDVRHAGVPTGTADRDNARTINRIKDVLSNYRETVTPQDERVVVTAVEIDDSRNSTADGIVQAGEVIEVTLTVENQTGGMVATPHINLSSNDRAVDVKRDRAIYPHLQPGESASTRNAFYFQLDRTAGANRKLLFEVTIEGSLGGEWSDYFLIDLGESAVQLVYEGATIDDDMSGTSNGDGDGVIEPGEEIEFEMLVRNLGHTRARLPKAQIRTFDRFVTMRDSANSFYDIEPRSVGPSRTEFEFDLAPNTPMGHRIQFDIDLESREGDWTDTMVLVVGSVELDAEVTLDDAAFGNGDGLLQAGEVIELDLALTGSGQTYASEVEVELVTEDPLVRITNADEDYGQVDPGATVSSVQPFRFSVEANGALEQEAVLEFRVRSEEMSMVVPVRYAVEVELPAPAVPLVAVTPGDAGAADVEVTLRGTLDGLVYAIERSVDLETWTEVEGEIAGTGGDVVRHLTEVDAGVTVFYRVVQRRP